jgi:membrane protease YdiL (CAAX protease family)
MSNRPPDATVNRPAPDTRDALRGFGPAGLLAILAILAGGALTTVIGALLVLAWVTASRTPWSAIGFVRPRSWPRTIVPGIAIGVTFKLVMKTLVMPLLGGPEQNAAYHFLVGNPRALVGVILASLIAGGVAEETFFRGWMFERLGCLLGRGIPARVVIVLLTSLLFALAHVRDQGLAGAEQALFTGTVFGVMFMGTRALPLVMITHAAFDLAATAIIFMGWETRLAHVFLR